MGDSATGFAFAARRKTSEAAWASKMAGHETICSSATVGGVGSKSVPSGPPPLGVSAARGSDGAWFYHGLRPQPNGGVGGMRSVASASNGQTATTERGPPDHRRTGAHNAHMMRHKTLRPVRFLLARKTTALGPTGPRRYGRATALRQSCRSACAVVGKLLGASFDKQIFTARGASLCR